MKLFIVFLLCLVLHELSMIQEDGISALLWLVAATIYLISMVINFFRKA